MLIRHAAATDLDAIAALESLCFPAAQACTRQTFRGRLTRYPEHFWLCFEDATLVSFADGLVTDAPDLADAMYAKPGLHDPHGAWQMIFGLVTHPAYRRQGYAGKVLCEAIAQAHEEKRKGLVLTCREELVHYYAFFGFENEGLSASVHGGVPWYQMRLSF